MTCVAFVIHTCHMTHSNLSNKAFTVNAGVAHVNASFDKLEYICTIPHGQVCRDSLHRHGVSGV